MYRTSRRKMSLYMYAVPLRVKSPQSATSKDGGHLRPSAHQTSSRYSLAAMSTWILDHGGPGTWSIGRATGVKTVNWRLHHCTKLITCSMGGKTPTHSSVTRSRSFVDNEVSCLFGMSLTSGWSLAVSGGCKSQVALSFVRLRVRMQKDMGPINLLVPISFLQLPSQS